MEKRHESDLDQLGGAGASAFVGARSQHIDAKYLSPHGEVMHGLRRIRDERLLDMAERLAMGPGDVSTVEQIDEVPYHFAETFREVYGIDLRTGIGCDPLYYRPSFGERVADWFLESALAAARLIFTVFAALGVLYALKLFAT